MPSQPRLILGLSDSHDAGAALLRDGVLIAAANEERFTRKKMQWGYPARSIEAVLDCAGVKASEIDAIAIAGSTKLGAVPINNDFSQENGEVTTAQKLVEALDRLPLLPHLMRSDASVAAYRYLMPLLAGGRNATIMASMREIGARSEVAQRLKTHDHHACHAASAWYGSGLTECLILSNDGFGDGLSSLVATGHNGRMEVISKTSFFDSLGVFYNYATLLCGFPKSHHAGKTTGLAAFGDARKTREIFAALCPWVEASERHVNRGPVFRNMIARLEKELSGFSREDIAAGVQAHVEDVLVAQAQYFLRKTGLRDIALAGGVHANVKANQRIAAIEGLRTLSVFPNMGDGGLAAGAAWLCWNEAGGAVPAPMQHAYLGPDISEQAAQRALKVMDRPHERPISMPEAIAEALANGKIVARAAGAMEYGPRALGNRSILYAATDRSVNSWLNAQLKRTEFMPFAPVCRAENAERHFKNLNPGIDQAASFMTITCEVTEECARLYPAITHVDGTARPQIIRREINPEYWDILAAYEAKTGLQVLVNTSFNMHEEPIICTAEEAIRSFETSAIDCLALGPYLLWRQD